MSKQGASFRKLLFITGAVAVAAVVLSLLYLSSEPGKMPLSEILATVFGVGATVFIAGGLTALMYFSSASGRDDAIGGRSRER